MIHIPQPDSAETALLATINYLRADEGDTVTLVCDNPDFNGQPNNAVDCNGSWTDWNDKRFTGDSLFTALNAAALAKAVATKTPAPLRPDSKGVKISSKPCTWQYTHPFNGVSYTEYYDVAVTWAKFGPITALHKGKTTYPARLTNQQKNKFLAAEALREPKSGGGV